MLEICYGLLFGFFAFFTICNKFSMKSTHGTWSLSALVMWWPKVCHCLSYSCVCVRARAYYKLNFFYIFVFFRLAELLNLKQMDVRAELAINGALAGNIDAAVHLCRFVFAFLINKKIISLVYTFTHCFKGFFHRMSDLTCVYIYIVNYIYSIWVNHIITQTMIHFVRQTHRFKNNLDFWISRYEDKVNRTRVVHIEHLFSVWLL